MKNCLEFYLNKKSIEITQYFLGILSGVATDLVYLDFNRVFAIVLNGITLTTIG